MANGIIGKLNAREGKQFFRREEKDNEVVYTVTVQRIEKGTRRPSYEVLCKLEDLFGMTHRYLLAKTDGDYEDKLIV